MDSDFGSDTSGNLIEVLASVEDVHRSKVLEHPELSKLMGFWLSGIALMYDAFNGALFRGRAEFRSIAEAQEHYTQRHLTIQQSVATRTCKVIHDLAISGYDNQSRALSRTVFEGYRRMLFVRYHPEQIFRFVPEDQIDSEVKGLEGYERSSRSRFSKEDWSSLKERLRDAKDDDWLHMYTVATGQSDNLNENVHPEFASSLDLWARVGPEYRVSDASVFPRFDEYRSTDTFRIGLMATAFVLMEIQAWANHFGDWERTHFEWQTACEAYFAAH